VIVSPDEESGSSLHLIGDHWAAQQKIADAARESGLKVQELKGESVIFNPDAPDKGRIHMEHSDGFVSRDRPNWDYFGYLEGCVHLDDDCGPYITAGEILGILADLNPDSADAAGGEEC
jgi:hypothetical protein